MFRKFIDGWEFHRWRRVHLRSPAAMRSWQVKRLRRLVRYARRTVPFYNNVLRTVRSEASLEELPVIDKYSFFQKPDAEYYIDNSRPFPLRWGKTSGTSGEPLRILLRRHVFVQPYVDFLLYRFLYWRGVRLKEIRTSKIAKIRVRGRSHGNRLFIPVSEFLQKTRDSAAALTAFRPDVIESYPSLLLALAHAVRQNGAENSLACRYAVSLGEVLTPRERVFIEENLGCEVYNRYGLEELGVIGVECSYHRGFHIYAESYIVEVLDARDWPLPSGARGRVVVTDLYNYDMPFIRYDTGDQGFIAATPCSCGMQTPLLFIDGRHSSFLAFGAKRLHHLEFDAALDGFHNAIMRYQVIKIAENAAKVLVVPGPFFDTATAEDVRQRVKRLIGEGISVSVEQTAHTLYTPAGKSRIVVDLSRSAAEFKNVAPRH